MAVQQGNNITLFIDIDEDETDASNITNVMLEAQYTAIEGITSAGVSLSNATYEVNFKNVTPPESSSAPVLSPTRAYSVGTTTSTLNVEGVYDPAETFNVDELFTQALAKTSAYGIFFSSGATGFQAIGGLGFLTSWELSAGMDDFVTFSAQFELTGDPVIIQES